MTLFGYLFFLLQGAWKALSWTLVTLLPIFRWFSLTISHNVKPLISILFFQTSSATCVQRPSQTQRKQRRVLGCYWSRRTDLHVEHVIFLPLLPRYCAIHRWTMQDTSLLNICVTVKRRQSVAAIPTCAMLERECAKHRSLDYYFFGL